MAVLPAEIIGFDKAAEVVTAKYEGKGTLTLLLYPTPQIAGDHGRQIEAEMNTQRASCRDGDDAARGSAGVADDRVRGRRRMRRRWWRAFICGMS